MNLHIVENPTVDPLLVEIFDNFDELWLSHFFHDVVEVIIHDL